MFIKSGKHSSKSDDEIISLYRKNPDPVYIEILFDRYNHLIFGVSMNYLKNEEDSKDAVVTIFTKLPADLLKFDIRHFSSWLHTVTKNYCLRVLSKKKYSSMDVSRLPDLPDEEEENFIKNYLPFLNEALNSLNAEQRKCIEMFYIDNLSYQEISEKTGFSLLQVKSHIQNGKRNLKIILTRKSK